MKTLAEGEHRKDSQSPGWVGYRIAGALGFGINEQGVEANIKQLVKKWLADGWLIEDMRNTQSKPRAFVVPNEDAPWRSMDG
jgi:hypothetical protein